MIRKQILIGLVLAAGFLFFGAHITQAATYTWDGGGDKVTWTDCKNWAEFGASCTGANAYPGATTTDDIVIQTQTGGGDITVRATSSLPNIGSVTLGGAGGTGGGPTLIIGNGISFIASTTVSVIGTSTLKLGDSTWGSAILYLENGVNNATPLSIGANASFVAATGTAVFNGDKGGVDDINILVATTTYYNLTF